jgi:protein-tyrosine phosphatase
MIIQVEKWLWVGSVPKATPRHINCIVNLVEGYETGFRIPNGPFVRLMFAPIPDGVFRGVDWLDSTVDTILRWHNEGLSTLIHCAAGLSRAPLVTTAVLMKSYSWGRDKALEKVRLNHPTALPNPYFMEGLSAYENFLGKVI